MKIYGTAVSPYVRKVVVALAEKGVAFEHAPVMFHDKTPAFQAASPFGKIPAMEDGDLRLCDSSAICHYIERKYPTPPLLPAEASAHATAIWFEEFSDTILIPALLKVFFQLVVQPRLFKKEPDMVIVETALAEDVPKAYDYLESAIAGPYLVGDTLTLADIAVASPFVNMAMAKQPIDATRWPRIAAYVAPILDRPSFVNARDKKPA
jgi:glutathione S-transferase